MLILGRHLLSGRNSRAAVLMESANRFGVAAVLLEMVPVAGILFAFTNTCGAALWAADIEQSEGTSPQLRGQAKQAVQ